MRTASGAGLLLSLLLASGAEAQQIPSVQEIVDVTVANVEVVVMDRAGNRVRGLTREDFESPGGKFVRGERLDLRRRHRSAASIHRSRAT